MGAFIRSIAGSLKDEYAAFPALANRRRQGWYTLSGGERRMLAMGGKALMLEPDLLLLD